MCTRINNKHVRLRKDRKCDGCWKKLLKGETVKKETLVEDGIYNLYFCDLCVAFTESKAFRRMADLDGCVMMPMSQWEEYQAFKASYKGAA